jgi:hypothetical protein
MGLRFFRRIRLSPGLTVNLSRGGASLSLARRGAHVMDTSGARSGPGFRDRRRDPGRWRIFC